MSPESSKKTVADLYQATEGLLAKEFTSLKGEHLSLNEDSNVHELAKLLTASVLEEMGISL